MRIEWIGIHPCDIKYSCSLTRKLYSTYPEVLLTKISAFAMAIAHADRLSCFNLTIFIRDWQRVGRWWLMALQSYTDLLVSRALPNTAGEFNRPATPCIGR